MTPPLARWAGNPDEGMGVFFVPVPALVGAALAWRL
jgi:hypothetical protein